MAGKGLLDEVCEVIESGNVSELAFTLLGLKMAALCKVLERRLEALQAQRVAEFELTRSQPVRRYTGVTDFVTDAVENMRRREQEKVLNPKPEKEQMPALQPGDYVRTDTSGFMVVKSDGPGSILWHVRRASDDLETMIAEHQVRKVYRGGRLLWAMEGA